MSLPPTTESVKVRIMGHEYIFTCAPDEKASLLKCAALVDDKMNAIKKLGRLSSVDRIAVMAALTIANDLLTATTAKQYEANQAASAVSEEHLHQQAESMNHEISQFVDQTRGQLNLLS